MRPGSRADVVDALPVDEIVARAGGLAAGVVGFQFVDREDDVFEGGRRDGAFLRGDFCEVDGRGFFGRRGDDAGAEFGEAKRWPAEHYAKVAELKIRAGWQVWLFGSKNDHPGGEDLRMRLIPGLREECTNLSGATSLAEAMQIIASHRSRRARRSGSIGRK